MEIENRKKKDVPCQWLLRIWESENESKTVKVLGVDTVR